jgi:hypothetical protein
VLQVAAPQPLEPTQFWEAHEASYRLKKGKIDGRCLAFFNSDLN